jgi:hypothetical protein
MSLANKFLNFLSNKPQLQFTLIVRNVLTYVLPTSPSGWEGSLITVSRSDTYYGMMRTFTIPMDWVLDGAWILRTEFYQYGVQGNVLFQIAELNPDTQAYDIIFTGQIDFSKIKDTASLEGYKFQANVMQNDFTALIAAYENTKFQIPLNTKAAVLVNMPGIQLNETAGLNFSASTDFRSNAFFALTVVVNQVNSRIPSVQNSGFVQQDVVNFTTTGEWFYKATCPGPIQLQGEMQTSVAPLGGSARYTVGIYRSSTGMLYQTLVDTGVLTVTTQVNFSWDFIIPDMAVNETLSCYFQNFDGDSYKGFNMQQGVMNLSYNTISPPSTVRAYPAFYIYQYLINAIYGLVYNGFTFPAMSTLLLSPPWNQLYITSGDAFRPAIIEFTYVDSGGVLVPGNYYTVLNGIGLYGGTVLYNTHTYFPGDTFLCIPVAQSFTSTDGAIVETGNNPAVIKTSFKDFFTSINTVTNCGFAVQNGVAVLEAKATFFVQSQTTADVGNVSSFANELYDKFVANAIRIGYPDSTFDTVSGREEVNSETTYTSLITRVQKELNLKSVYSASSLEMEFQRIQLGAQNATNNDNKVYFIKLQLYPVEGQAYYQPETVNQDGSVDGLYANVQGVPVGYFNIDLSPKNCLLRHANYLAGMLWNVPGQILLGAALKNDALATIDLSGKAFQESTPIDISTLGTPLFLPLVVTIKTKLPKNILNSISMFPNGKINFTVDGNVYYGFMLNADVDIAKNSDREYKLLLTSQNNLLNLIR